MPHKDEHETILQRTVKNSIEDDPPGNSTALESVAFVEMDDPFSTIASECVLPSEAAHGSVLICGVCENSLSSRHEP